MSDSFADLWNISAPLPAKPKPQTLTLAARLAEENDKRNRAISSTAGGVQSQKAPDVSYEAWAGLDSLESGIKVKVDDVDDWGFGSAAAVAAKPNPTSNSKAPQSYPISQKVDSPDMDFDFGMREDQDDLDIPTGTRDLKSSSILNLLDDDDNDDDDHLMGGGIGGRDQGLPQETGGFDDVLRGGATVAGHDEDEEDILGVLSKPVDVVIANKNSSFGSSRTSTPPRPTPPPSRQGSRAPSPPPPPPPQVRGPPKGWRERERERKEREAQQTRRENNSSRTRAGPTTAADIQDQADKLLLQASEIGLNVLSRATAFWKEGKEKVVKVMEERTGGGSIMGSRGGFEERGRGKNSDGRPRWMKEAASDEDEGDEFKTEGFKDGVQEHIDMAHQEPTVDLFSSDPVPTRSVSRQQQRPSQPSTRTHSRPPPPRRRRTLITASSSTLSLAFNHKNTGTSQFKLGQYGLASETYSSAITLLPPGHLLLVPLYTNRSLARLKCGEYVGAGEDAREALNIICVADSNTDNPNTLSNGNGNVLWNPDTELLELIQGGRDKVNQGGWLDPRGVGVDLVDGYVKALKRRAEAWEGREKWVEAGRDWEILAGGGGGVGKDWIGEGIRKEAVRGAGRCRKMVSASSEKDVGFSSSSSLASKPSSSKPKTKPTPSRPPSSQPSKALLAHQATALQAEADDSLKHQLKDSVDARISAWKNGKETNIRALLASLDMVLWREILSGGVKVNGLGELVTDVQVKKGYMKAIARVHPDKFNTSNSTVEQRMLANSVFAALNEAWIAFQGGK